VGKTWRGVLERLGKREMSRLNPPGSWRGDLDTYIGCVVARESMV
jgi:hypothetical protein